MKNLDTKKKRWLDKEKDLEIYIANKTKSNPKEFYSYVHNKKNLSHQNMAHVVLKMVK